MAPIWYRLRSVLRAHRGRTTAIAVVVAAVSALVLALSAGALRTLSAPERYSAAQGDAYDVSLEQLGGRPRTAEVAALPAVAGVEVSTFVFGGVLAVDGEVVEGFVFAGSPQAFGARVVEGREPDPARPDEFVATQAWLSQAAAQLGDRFEVLTITQGQADERGFDVPEPAGPTLTATLVGVIDGPSELEDAMPLALFGERLLEVGDVGVSSTVGVIALEPPATVDDLRAQLDTLPRGEEFGLGEADLVPAAVRSAVRVQGQGLAVVAAIVAVAAIAVLGQLLSRQVRLPIDQKLAMNAIGLTRAQVVADQLGAVALPVATGSVAGSVVAIAASGAFPVGFSRRVEPNPGPLFEPLVHVVGVVFLTVLVTAWVLVAMLLADRDSRVRQRPGAPELVASRFRSGPAATGLRFALTHHPRDPGSVRAPLIGLVLVLGVLVAALTFGASVSRFIDRPERYGANFDFATGVGGDAVPEEVRELLEHHPDVADVTLYGTLFASVGSTALDVTGMQPVRGSLEPDLLASQLARRADEITLGRVAARDLGVEIGDELTVTGAQGPVEFRVIGLAVIPSIEGGDGIGEGGVVTLAGLRRLDPDAKLGAAAVRLRPGATGATQRIGEAIGMTIGLPDTPATVVNLGRVRSTPFVVAASLAALAALSVAHQLLTSARRRRRDLAVLRALGADRRWVSGVLHWQATVLVVTVAAVAVPLGWAAGGLIHRAYIDRIGGRSDVSFRAVLTATVILGLVVLGNLAAVVPARRANDEPPAGLLALE